MKKTKKIIVLLIVILALQTMTACGSKNTDKTPSNAGSTSGGKDTVNVSKAKIKEKVIVDRDDIKITAKSLEFDSYDVQIKILIENNSSQNITVQNRHFSINGLMLNASLSADVSAGKKSNSSLRVDLEDLKVSKISKIKDIEFSLSVLESDSWDDIFIEKEIKLETDVKRYTQKYNTDGYLAVDQDGVKIYVLKLKNEDSFWGADVMIYAENNTKEDITIQTRDVSIDGFMVDPSFSLDILASKKAYDSIYFFEEDLKDNDIKDIKEIDLKFLVFNAESWKDLFTTKIIKVKF